MDTPLGSQQSGIEPISGPLQELWRLFRQRYINAQRIADLMKSLLEACYYYAIPNKNRFYRPKQFQGEFRGSRLYDTTAIEAVKTFVSKMQSSMTPPQVQWGYLDIDETQGNLEVEEKFMLQETLNTYMQKLFVYIHQSNFDTAINECFFDLSIGTASLIINQFTDKQPLLFTSIPMDKLAIEEAMNGKIESWFRTWEDVKIAEITTRWKNAIIPPDMIQQTIDTPDAVVTILYEGVMYLPNNEKPYLYMVGTAETPLVCEWYEINPGIVWRFQKINNEIFGRGPVMDALPSIISLNELARIELAAANLNTFKPYMGFSDAVFNPHTFKLEPFTVIPIAPIGVGGSAPLVPLPDSSNPQFSQLTIQDLRMQIKTLLFNEANQTQSIQPVTATDRMIDQQNLAERIGPLFSRLQSEFLWPIIQRVGYILDKMGHLPYPDLKGIKIQFRYKSPLALAKGQQEIARFTQWFQLMQGIMGPNPAMLYINPKKMPYVTAMMMQVNEEFLNTPDEVAMAGQNMQNMQDQTMLAGQQPGEVPQQ